MVRILAAAAVLGLSLVTLPALAHGGSRGGSGGMSPSGNSTFVPQPASGGAGDGKVLTTIGSSSCDDGRELAEKQRIKTELTTIETRALLLTERPEVTKVPPGTHKQTDQERLGSETQAGRAFRSVLLHCVPAGRLTEIT